MNEHCAIILSSLKALTTKLSYSHIVCGLCISYNKNKLLALFSWRLGDLIHLTSFLIAREVHFRLLLGVPQTCKCATIVMSYRFPEISLLSNNMVRVNKFYISMYGCVALDGGRHFLV